MHQLAGPEQLRVPKLRIGLLVLLTLLSLFIFLLFLFSMGRAISWNSSELNMQLNIMVGEFSFAWRPPDWRLENDPYAGFPGWSLSEHGAAPKVLWWPQRFSGKTFIGVSIPLWIPFVLVFIPAAFVGYGIRRWIAKGCSHSIGRVCPVHPLKWTVWRSIAYMVFHILVLIPLTKIAMMLIEFFHSSGSGGTDHMELLSRYLFSPLFLLSPFFGALWALLEVRMRNRLFHKRNSDRCISCGYNLQGTLSNRCPECGVVFVRAQSPSTMD